MRSPSVIRAWALPGVVALMLACVSATGAPAAEGSRKALDFRTLMHGHYRSEVDMSAYAMPADALPPTQTFSGTLRLSGKPRTRTLLADRDFLSPVQIAQSRTFPEDFAYDFVQYGSHLLPVRRGYIVIDHPHWDFVLEPGRVWNEPGDHGYTRAALPFALVQKHMNCTHYGVMSFVFRSDGAISRAAMQVSSETCRYLKLDMWGLLDATYVPHVVASSDKVVEAFRAHQAKRLPTRPIAQLAHDHPGVDPAGLAIGESRARTLYGLVVDGINYVSDCPTRRGDFPYCDALPIPSYSTAKSALASLALMMVEQAHPGAAQLAVTKYAPVARCAEDDWDGVTFRDLLDMATGHFDSRGYMKDEDSVKAGGFFRATTGQGKARFACGAYPRRMAPGKTWVYHTSDTFLLGDVLNRYLRSLPGQSTRDIFRDVVVARAYRPLGLSATARVSRRTADKAAQPFFGYGLQFQRDDLARLALFIGTGHGRIDGRQVLDPHLLDLALQRVAGEHGLPVDGFPAFRYQLGFWARNVAPVLGCAKPLWIPFMSGFGGLSVVLFPNGIVYYNVSDSGTARAFDWSRPAQVVNRIDAMCR